MGALIPAAISDMRSREIAGSEIQGSQGWHDARLGKFTGSKLKELVSLMSDKPKSTADKYIYEKMAEIITGTVEEIPMNKYMERGVEYEPIAMAWLEDFLETRLVETGALLMQWSDRVAVSPDRIGILDNGDKIVVESKSPKSTTHLKWAAAGKCPSEHRIQVQSEIMVSGADYAYFLSYDDRCIGQEAFLIKVMPDKKMQDRIRTVCEGSLEKLDLLLENSKKNTIDIKKMYF